MEGAWRALGAELTAAGLKEGAGEPPAITGPDYLVVAVCGARESMGPGSLSFATEEGHLASAVYNGAEGIVTSPGLKGGFRGNTGLVGTFVLTGNPRLLFASALNTLEREFRPKLPQGEPLYADRDSCQIGEGVSFGPFCYIGKNVKIGPGSLIGPYAFLEDEAEIGANTILHPRVTVRWRARIGANCVIHSGCVIGGDGFGYTQVPVPEADRLLHYRNAHLGSVSIGDNVEMGSLTAVDRGFVEDSVIGPGTKLDNLAQIGHNAKIGRDAIVVSQVGVGGHAEVGDRVFLLGQAGLSHGVSVGDDAIITGQSGVTGRVPPGRKAWGGTPARPMEEYLRDIGLARRQLPLLQRFLAAFKKSRDFDGLKKAFHGEGGPGLGEDGPEKPQKPQKPEKIAKPKKAAKDDKREKP
jgi:UDP-3-O-[3-hydroxymyristoyl] glucosamine N-acyltransferase